MANISISIAGIEQAVENLKYRPSSVKKKAVMAIKSFYISENAFKEIQSIDTDILIKKIWDAGEDFSTIKSKRRNFFSLTSSINADLKKLSKKGLNPENISISDANVFDMAEEAKNDLLRSFTDTIKTGNIDLEQATDILKTIMDFFTDIKFDTADDQSMDMIKELKKLLNKISHESPSHGDDTSQLSSGNGIDPQKSLSDSDSTEPAPGKIGKEQELAEKFDNALGEKEKKVNAYVKVPKGNYTIGTEKNLKNTLELQQFDMPEVYIGAYPVTNSLFETFIDQTGYITTAEKKGSGIVYHSRYKKSDTLSSWNKSSGSEEIKKAFWYQPSGPGSSLHGKRNHPVVQVSIEDAIAYASWIGRRIPTEAEWESAARTDLGYKYPWGIEFRPNALNIETGGLSDTCPVDEYDDHSNEFKIIDLLGNVMEWTSDMEKPPFKTKQDVQYCVAKGGAWNASPDITISSRALFKNQFTSNTIGFRCISEICL